MAPRTPEEEAAREAWARSQGMGWLYPDPAEPQQKPAEPAREPTLADRIYKHLIPNKETKR